MRVHLLALAIPVLAALVGGWTLSAWYGQAPDSAPALEERVPRQWPRKAILEPTQIPDRLVVGSGKPSALMGSWSQFRGARRDGVANLADPLSDTWPGGRPRELWRVAVGAGYAGPAIANGRVYLVDYDRATHENVIRCLSFDTGDEIWRYAFTVKVKFNHGMSRTVPAVTDRYVVAIGPLCNVRCVDAVTGELKWKKNMVAEFGATVPKWYTGQCPLIDGDRVILAPGGDPLLMACDLETGKILWRTENPGKWAMTHSSVVPADFGGVPQYVYCGSRGVISVAADDGRVLWQWNQWRVSVVSPSPVRVGTDRLLFTADYGAGSQMVRVTRAGDTFKVEELWRRKAGVFSCKQQTPVVYRDHLFAVLPKGRVVCSDAEGNRRWISRSKVSSGWGPFMVIGDRLYILNDDSGELIVADASPSGYRERARAKVLDGREAWAPMAFADGRLICRDMEEMVCLDLAARPDPVAEEAGR